MKETRSVWLKGARLMVERVHEDLGASATLRERRKALRAAGPDFHGYTMWGRRMWGRACREYLEQHGQPPKAPPPVEAAPNFGPDIIFPFRSKE